MWHSLLPEIPRVLCRLELVESAQGTADVPTAMQLEGAPETQPKGKQEEEEEEASVSSRAQFVNAKDAEFARDLCTLCHILMFHFR